MYSVKEIYYTLQGEGALSGRAAVFCRFAGCNLWSGHEKDRHSATCQFCDTDFVGTDGPGGGKFDTAEALALAISGMWPQQSSVRGLVVCTGGEPLLQVDSALIQAIHGVNFDIAIETNGTLKPPADIDWICVSPKANAEFILQSGNELKLVFPQKGCDPADYEHLEFEHFFLQPMDGNELGVNTNLAVEYCKAHPQWRLSLQTHKYIGIN